jgi:hypothetical protein
MAGLTMAEGWTVAEAVEQFAGTGVPMDGLARIIRALPGFQRIGEKKKPPGSKGGRGDAVYSIADLQRLHSKLAEWLVPQDPPSGDT